MRTLATLIGTIAPATAFAAANVPAVNDGIFVWIFLGFFAMVVIGQLIPAVMLVVGLAKGMVAKPAAEIEAR